jgi:serine/threonine protein kinase
MTDSPENDASPAPGLLAVGSIIGGRYRIHELLGRGGMGVVYAASHELTQRKVALKVLDSTEERDAQRERFLGEARTAAAVRHPNIVDILDMGIHRGAPYLVMERLEGNALDPVLSNARPLTYEQTLAWLLPIIGALAVLHDAGIVHRDIKPSNIFLSRAPHQVIVPKLLDFGLARAVSDARLTRSGVVIGTPFYMAPEHAAGGAVGPAADVWSMGVVLYECIAGALPYSSTDRAVVAAQVLAGHVRPLRQARPEVPPALATAIEGALQRDLGIRHPSMRALAYALVTAAVTSGIHVPDHVDPIGLPEASAWKMRAQARLAAGELSPTHELPIALGAPDNINGRPRRRWPYVLVALLALAGLAMWLWWPGAVTPPPIPTPPQQPPAQADTPPSAPFQPEVLPVAPGTATGSTGTPPATPEVKPARPARPHEPPRKKPKRTDPVTPAEVETEWK